MVYNRLRELRKNDLDISSIDKLAEILGGEDAGWYQQRLQRIETGHTLLTDKDAHEISKKLRVPIWALFEDCKDLELLRRFDKADDHVKLAVKSLLGMK